LLTQNLFLQVAVEEGVGDIELLGGPATGRSNGENHLDRRQLHDGSEGFVEVDAGALSESPNHPTSLVPFQSAFGVKFMLEHPFAGHDVGARRSIDETPCGVALERVELRSHGCAPVWILESCASR
jgi:hypothetical protein